MKKLFVIIAINFMFNGCGIYTFSGASIPNEANTIGINYFTNKAANVQPILSQLFTEKLKDRVVEQTRLILSDEGDLQFSGFISEYTIKPIAITSTETASKNRLTIKVDVKFSSKLDKTTNYQKIFSRYRDYNSNEEISNIEEDLINVICDELIEDIFNTSFGKW